MERMTIQIESSFEKINQVEQLVEQVCDHFKVHEDYFGNILVALTEAVNNAIQHGNKFDKAKTIEISFVSDGNKLRFEVKDQGPGFDPDIIPDPTAPENIEKPNGRGIFLMKNLADSVNYTDNGTRVSLSFNVFKN